MNHRSRLEITQLHSWNARKQPEINEAAEELRNEIEQLRESLSEKTASFDQHLLEKDDLMRDREEMKKVIADRDDSIGRLQEKITQLEEDISYLRETSTLEKRRLLFENDRLRERVDSLEKKIEFLEQYKDRYDVMHDAFMFRPEDDKFTLGQKRSRKPVMASKKNHLLMNIQAAKKLEEQLLEVQNQCIAEFDSYLEDHKLRLQRMPVGSEEMTKIDMELNTEQDRFTHTIGALQEELTLMRQHLHYLNKELDSARKPLVPKPPSRGGAPQPPSRVTSPLPPSEHSSSVGKQSRLSGKDSILSSADNFNNVDLLSNEMDPFIPQEAILSKYSLMIYASTNGKESYHQLKDAKFCPSCCEMTVVCPHKVNQEKVITLPHNCTHIKLTRPKIKIPSDRKQRSSTRPCPPTGRGRSTVDNIFEMEATDTKQTHGGFSRPSNSARCSVQPYHKDSVTPGLGLQPENTSATPRVVSSTAGSVTALTERDGKAESTQEHKQNSLFMIWDEYAQRTHITRSVAKPMDFQQCLSLIGQFYSRVLWSDEHALEMEKVESVVDYLYGFFGDRYMLENVTFLCMHDFISGILEYSSVSKHIQLFCHVMVGNLDAATFRYLLIVGDLIDRVTWKSIGDFKVFIKLLYRFLNEDEIDQLHLAYTSFSENRVSKSLVYEYFMYIILKYREPRFQDVEVKLLQLPVKEFGVMSHAEFVESMDALSPLINERLGQKLYAESEQHYSEEGKVSVARLAQIASYLLLLQDAALLRQKIADEVEDNRFRSSPLVQGAARKDSLVDDSEDIMTMAKLRNLAKKISHCEQARSMRRIETNLKPNLDNDGENMPDL